MRIQKGLCAICNVWKYGLVVDHCHICGFKNRDAVRGLLCFRCNNHSSLSLDKPNILNKAYDYSLEHWNRYHRPVVV